MTIQEIEEILKIGQCPPTWLAEAKDWLASESSTLMDRQLELQIKFAEYFKEMREKFQSDNAVRMTWVTEPLGIEQISLETQQRKIKVLREAISSHLRVASDQARNLY
jgi:hypothetical protein